MQKYFLALIVLIFGFGFNSPLAVVHCLPDTSGIAVGVAGTELYRDVNVNVSRGGNLSLKFNSDSCVDGGKTRTDLIIACGFDWASGASTPGSCTSTASCFYADPANNTFTGAPAAATSFTISTAVGNQFDFGAVPVYCSIKVGYDSELIANVPWLQLPPLFTSLQASRPIAGATIADSNVGTMPSAPAACSDVETWYADPNSAVTTPCDISTPCTLQGALNKVDSGGDTVLLNDGSGGTYTIASGPYTLPNVSGTVRCPIVVKAINRGAAHMAATAGTLWSVTGSRAWWILDGVGVSVASGAVAINISSTGSGNGARYITDDDASMNAAGKILTYGFNGNGALSDSVFENFTLTKGYTSDMTDFSSFSGPVTIRGWNVDNASANASHFLYFHGFGMSSIIEDSIFKNFGAAGCTEGCVFYYLGGENSIFRRNGLYSMPIGVEFERTGRILVENNAFVNVNLAVNPRKRSIFNDVRNNIFQDDNAGGSIAVRFSGAGPGCCPFAETGSSASYNASCGFSTTLGSNSDGNITYTSLNGFGVLTRTGLCAGPVAAACGTVSDASKCNCGLTSPSTGDFTIDPNGPCDDAGDPNSAVPNVTGNNGRRDMGPCEAGTCPPFNDYVTTDTVSDTGPRFQWTFMDPQNQLATVWPNMMRNFSTAGAPLESDAQANCRIQIDESPYFNSVASGNANGPGYPLYDVTQASSNEYFTLIDGSLTSGHCYYWRVMCTDDVLTTRYSNWSAETKKVCVN